MEYPKLDPNSRRYQEVMRQREAWLKQNDPLLNPPPPYTSPPTLGGKYTQEPPAVASQPSSPSISAYTYEQYYRDLDIYEKKVFWDTFISIVGPNGARVGTS